MSYFEVRYKAYGLCLSGSWVDYMNSGFISEDCTLDEVQTLVNDYVATFDGKVNRISTPIIRLISDEERQRILNSDSCFWGRQLSKMTNNAIERFRQNNC